VGYSPKDLFLQRYYMLVALTRECMTADDYGFLFHSYC